MMAWEVVMPKYGGAVTLPHCIGYENGATPEGFAISCGRGALSDKSFETIIMLVASGYALVITSMVIIVSMTLTYGSVRKIEKKMQNYEAGALCLRAQQQQQQQVGGNNTSITIKLTPALCTTSTGVVNNANIKNARQIFTNTKNKLKSIISSCIGRGDSRPVSRSNAATSQKRAILHMARGYSLAWFITMAAPYLIYGFFVPGQNITEIVVYAFVPLQGLFNLIVYMSPKIQNAKNARRANLGWCQATVKAWKSKGEVRREITATRSTFGRSPKKQIIKQVMKQISTKDH